LQNNILLAQSTALSSATLTRFVSEHLQVQVPF